MGQSGVESEQTFVSDHSFAAGGLNGLDVQDSTGCSGSCTKSKTATSVKIGS